MKKLFIILLSILSLTAFAQENNVGPSRIPKWFMQPSQKSYVGISAPGATEQDAINMAILQLILAHDGGAKCKSVIDEYSMSSSDSYANKTTENIEMVFDTVVRYTVQNISRLESGEYICRLTDGGKKEMSVKLLWERTFFLIDIDGESNWNLRVKFMGQFGDGKWYIDSYNSGGESEKERKMREEEYSFAYMTEYPGMRSVFKSPFFQDTSSPHYVFPKLNNNQQQSYVPAVFFSVDNTICLFEQLMMAYWKIFYEGFTTVDKSRIESTEEGVIYDTRKATPIVGFSYEDGVFEIQYKGE